MCFCPSLARWVLHWLRCWVGSRSRQRFPEGKPHGQQLCLRCNCSSVTWAGPHHKIFWHGCSVLHLPGCGTQRPGETRAEGDLIWEKLLFELLRAVLWILEVQQNTRIPQDSFLRASSLEIQTSRHWHISLCLPSFIWGLPDPAHGPGPCASPVCGCPCPAGPKGAASHYCSLKKTVQETWHFRFNFFLSFYVLHIQLRE